MSSAASRDADRPAAGARGGPSATPVGMYTPPESTPSLREDIIRQHTELGEQLDLNVATLKGYRNIPVIRATYDVLTPIKSWLDENTPERVDVNWRGSLEFIPMTKINSIDDLVSGLTRIVYAGKDGVENYKSKLETIKKIRKFTMERALEIITDAEEQKEMWSALHGKKIIHVFSIDGSHTALGKSVKSDRIHVVDIDALTKSASNASIEATIVDAAKTEKPIVVLTGLMITGDRGTPRQFPNTEIFLINPGREAVFRDYYRAFAKSVASDEVIRKLMNGKITVLNAAQIHDRFAKFTRMATELNATEVPSREELESTIRAFERLYERLYP
jgi:hypothetical protein